MCKCVLYYCHRVTTQLQSTNIYYIVSFIRKSLLINPLNAELKSHLPLLLYLGAHHILHVSRIRVKLHGVTYQSHKIFTFYSTQTSNHAQIRNSDGDNNMSHKQCLFLGAFAKLRKAIIASSCPSVRPHGTTRVSPGRFS